MQRLSLWVIQILSSQRSAAAQKLHVTHKGRHKRICTTQKKSSTQYHSTSSFLDLIFPCAAKLRPPRDTAALFSCDAISTLSFLPLHRRVKLGRAQQRRQPAPLEQPDLDVHGRMSAGSGSSERNVKLMMTSCTFHSSFLLPLFKRYQWI